MSEPRACRNLHSNPIAVSPRRRRAHRGRQPQRASMSCSNRGDLARLQGRLTDVSRRRRHRGVAGSSDARLEQADCRRSRTPGGRQSDSRPAAFARRTAADRHRACERTASAHRPTATRRRAGAARAFRARPRRRLCRAVQAHRRRMSDQTRRDCARSSTRSAFAALTIASIWRPRRRWCRTPSRRRGRRSRRRHDPSPSA